jgi:hypothetical protein
LVVAYSREVPVYQAVLHAPIAMGEAKVTILVACAASLLAGTAAPGKPRIVEFASPVVAAKVSTGPDRAADTR